MAPRRKRSLCGKRESCTRKVGRKSIAIESARLALLLHNNEVEATSMESTTERNTKEFEKQKVIRREDQKQQKEITKLANADREARENAKFQSDYERQLHEFDLKISKTFTATSQHTREGRLTDTDSDRNVRLYTLMKYEHNITTPEKVTYPRRKRSLCGRKESEKRKVVKKSQSIAECVTNETYSNGNTLFKTIHILGDGNCLFNSVSMHLFGNISYHHQLRIQAVDFVLANWDDYRLFILAYETNTANTIDSPQKYEAEMKTNGVYGGEVELSAIAYTQSVKINVYVKHHPEESPSVYGGHFLHDIHLLFSGTLDRGHYDVLVMVERDQQVHSSLLQGSGRVGQNQGINKSSNELLHNDGVHISTIESDTNGNINEFELQKVLREEKKKWNE